jgi:8-oxo-dGTP pyrophosphatase MutT (NUDIX family)
MEKFTMSDISAAGFVVFKHNKDNNLFFLGLVALPEFQDKNKGIYDIPKGRIDLGESPLKAAIREAQEEANLLINEKNIYDGPFNFDKMSIWLAESHEKPSININPTTGIKEHLGYTWLKPEVLEAQCLNYLKPFIAWARKCLGDI